MVVDLGDCNLRNPLFIRKVECISLMALPKRIHFFLVFGMGLLPLSLGPDEGAPGVIAVPLEIGSGGRSWLIGGRLVKRNVSIMAGAVCRS